jgi:protein dithiol:quinone oxidoreductase
VVALCGAGVAAAWWQHFVAAKSSSCALTLADKVITTLGVDTRWPELFEVRASCADAAADLLGVPFEFWSLALFALVAIVALISAITPARRHG